MVMQNLAAREVKLVQTQAVLKQLHQDHAKACGQHSRLLSLSFKSIIEVQILRGGFHQVEEEVKELKYEVFKKNTTIMAQELKPRGCGPKCCRDSGSNKKRAMPFGMQEHLLAHLELDLCTLKLQHLKPDLEAGAYCKKFGQLRYRPS